MRNTDEAVYRIQPVEGSRFVEFIEAQAEINGEKHRFSDFINSGQYKIHEVVVIGGNQELWQPIYHVWYGEKGKDLSFETTKRVNTDGIQ